MLKRVLLVYGACLLMAGGYAWLRISHTYGRPAFTDAPIVVFETLLLVVILAVALGAGVLWVRTRHPAALIQLITSSVTSPLAVVEQLAKELPSAQMPQLFEWIRQPHNQFAVQTVALLCFVTYPAAYIWYALALKRI